MLLNPQTTLPQVLRTICRSARCRTVLKVATDFDRNYFSKSEPNFVSVNNPTARMPWACSEVTSTSEAAE